MPHLSSVSAAIAAARDHRTMLRPPMSYYVTTPIYYVNAEPHLGHAYTTIGADILARHMRERGEDVFFLTGTDEHGEPVEQAAAKLGIPPEELADRNAAKFQELMPLINASNDFFIRTSDPRHKERVAEVMQRVYDGGWVRKGVYEGWYCPRCADFKTERELGPGHTCPIHEIELERESEENWFFRLSDFQERLERLYEERPDFVLPEFRRNEAVAFIGSGLDDVSLSRPKLKWGMTLPWDPGQRMYVWFDALLNYYTALSFAREDEDLTPRYWPPSFQIMAKDILKFHAVIWPALLMAAELPLPRHLFIHGFLLMGEKKMSKSLGNVLDPFEVIERFGADALRFYCFREVSFGQDGAISAAGFEARYETELANDFGNLASRTLAMVDRYRDATVPEAQIDPALAGGEDGLAGVEAEVCELLDRAELTQALERIWMRVRRLNRYVEEVRPWELAKDEARSPELDRVLYNLTEGLRVLTLLLRPYMPETMSSLLAALGEESFELTAFGSAAGGHRIERIPPLFPKLEAAAG
jgi:methionyl-tRNA synthetase